MRKHMDAIVLAVASSAAVATLTLMATGVWAWTTGVGC